MADARLLDKIHALSDLELAVLLCLVAREHCLIGTEPDSVDELAEELRLIASKTFNLSSAIISCHAHTTLDEFATGLLAAHPSPGNTRSVSPYHPRYEQPQSSTEGPSSAAGTYFPITPASRAVRGSLSPRIGSTIGSPSPAIGVGASNSQASHQPRIANVILAKDLGRAPRAVQIQALELLRTRRIFTRTSVQTAPKQFLFIALVGGASGGQSRVTPHLNDFFYLAHWHDPEDGLPYLDEESGQLNRAGAGAGVDELDDGASTNSNSSVVKRGSSSLGTSGTGLGVIESKWLSLNKNSSSSSTSSSNSSIPKATLFSFQQPQQHHHHQHQPPTNSDLPQEPPTPVSAPLFAEGDISLLAQLSQQTHVDVDVTRYQMNLISFLRTHRAVAGGVSPTATKHLERLAKSLAPLHGLDFVTPSLVALAAKKVYLHRIQVVADPERERSMQWGSELGAVRALLEGVGPEEVIEDVIGLVAVPS
ncbi:magnesium chelatase [Madurella fahalii]|uniref:magnesium chelatase n=1 Tax=Madurella fahalii TaxID=1157608 RepID=A0ABQ0G8R6_9PEZI